MISVTRSQVRFPGRSGGGSSDHCTWLLKGIFTTLIKVIVPCFLSCFGCLPVIHVVCACIRAHACVCVCVCVCVCMCVTQGRGIHYGHCGIDHTTVCPQVPHESIKSTELDSKFRRNKEENHG